MKRKDWRIKKLTKNIFGRIRKIKKYPEKIIKIRNLRKLFVKRNKSLFKKNFFTNYFFYSIFLKSFKLKKNNYFNNYFVFNNIDYIIYNPDFFSSKKVFNLDKDFKELIIDNKLNYIFINKNFNKINFIKNNKILILDNSNTLKDLIINNKDEDKIFPISVKYTNPVKDNLDFTFFINFNLNFLLILELYKILIILNLNKLK